MFLFLSVCTSVEQQRIPGTGLRDAGGPFQLHVLCARKVNTVERRVLL